MLYVTTRNRWNTYTAQWAISRDTGDDGGLFVPMNLPTYDAQQLQALGNQSLYETVAQVLNQFFSAKLTQQDVRFAVGRTTVNLVTMSHRMVVLELWRNAAGDFSQTVQKLARRLGAPEGNVADWVQIAVEIAFLFGIFGQLIRMGEVDIQKEVDVAVAAGDFTAPMAVWYARQMGLPVQSIVCGCNENGAPWELLHKGELRTGACCVSTSTPLADVALPRALERLVSATLGDDAVGEYMAVCGKGGIYAPQEEQWTALRKGVYASVAGDRRLENLAVNVYKTNGYLLGPYAALSYAGLMDYRATAGGNTTALLLSMRSPALDGSWIEKAVGVTADRISALTELS